MTRSQQKNKTLDANAKILESLHIEEDSGYSEFDLIMGKIQIGQPRKMVEVKQIETMSIES